MIEAHDLTKIYGDKVAVDHLSFTVEPGRVTGFLGPNGAGKSTTMRLILGLDRPQAAPPRSTAGVTATCRIRCTRSARCSRPSPCTRAAAARNHLLFLAQTQGLPAQPGRRGAGPGRPAGGGGQAGRRLLAGHEPAARRSRGPARRPARSCCWTSRSTGSIPRASCGSGT